MALTKTIEKADLLLTFALRLSAYIVAFTFSTFGLAKAEEDETLLIPHLNLSVVCWQNPIEEGWVDISYDSFVSSRYGLLVQRSEAPRTSLPFSDVPYKFRLIVEDFPCFYEYASHQFRRYGTYLDVTVPFTFVEVEGMTLPRIQDDPIVIPIIRELFKSCNSKPPAWPFSPILTDCEREISDILVTETTAIKIHYDDASPDAYETIIFLRGLPYFQGEPLHEF